jgi:hypothetical protein
MDWNDMKDVVEAQLLKEEAAPFPVRSTPLLDLLQQEVDKAMDVRNQTKCPVLGQRYLEAAIAIRHAMNELTWIEKQI